MARSLIEIREEAQELSDKAGTDFVEDPRWNIWVNRGIRKLWSFVIQANPSYLQISTDFSLTAGVNAFTLPTGLRIIINVERDPLSAGRYFLRPTTLSQKNTQQPRVPMFRRDKASVLVEPQEWAAGAYRLYYVGSVAELVNDPDEIDDVLDSWWEFPALWAAIKAKDKEEVGRAELMSELSQLSLEIQKELKLADSAIPKVITDVTDLGDPDYLFNRRV